MKLILQLKNFATYFYTILCFFIFNNVNAQDIKGTVTDSESKPLGYVTITIKKDSSKTRSIASDAGGKYFMNGLQIDGKYHVTFSLIGYQNIDTLILLKNNFSLNVRLQVQENLLKTVSVTARKNILERKVDRLIFNVENNINTIGLDGMELLQKTPLIRVDGDALKMVGKQDLSVMIDGKLLHINGTALINFIRTINADNISKIEVITNPPAQYDAAGNSGMINIITKKNRAPGYYGTLSERINFDSYATSVTNLNLNYNLKNLLMFGSIIYSKGANGPTSGQTRYYQNQIWSRNDKLKEKSNYLSGTWGLEYILSRNTTLGASYNTSNSYPDMPGTTQTITQSRATGLTDSVLHSNFLNRKNYTSNTLNLHLSQKLDTLGKILEFDADAFNSGNNTENNSLNFNTFPDGSETSLPKTNIASNNFVSSKGLTFNAEFNLPFKIINVVAGAKASFVKSSNNVTFQQGNTDSIVAQTGNFDKFQYSENIQAVFVNLNKSFGNWAIQAGLRGEATQSTGISVELSQKNSRSYLNLFPTFYLTYKASKEDNISINYGRRISRPYFSSLDPFKTYQDLYDYSIGNPLLRPSFTNNYELSNTYHHLLNTTLSYGVTTNESGGIQLVNNNSNIQVTTVGNFFHSKNYLLDNSISTTVFKWLQTTDDFSIYYSETTSTSNLTKPQSNGWGADVSSSNSIYFDEAQLWTLGLDVTHQFPFVSGIYHYMQYTFADLSASTVFFNKKLQVSLALRDIFKTKNIQSVATFNNIDYASIANNDSRRFLINLRYSFGNNKIHKGSSHNSSGSEQARSGN
ncbi:MAG: TonB-dependent receptor [Bacteroidota bacterium]|nr:TonB-dependent receptor [Bacteroidota bacterium]